MAKKINRDVAIVLVLIPILALLNEVVQPFQRAEKIYQRPYESSHAAYQAINEGADRIVVVRLPEAEDLMHPMAFWMGNKIYNREPALWLYPEYYQLLFKNMNIEFYNNQEAHPFGYFRPFLVLSPQNKEVVLFKNENLYTRIFLNEKGLKILRAAVIPYAPRDNYRLNFPELSSYGVDHPFLQLTLTFSGDLNNVKKIFYGHREVQNWKRSDGRIIFLTKDLSLDNDLSVTFHVPETRLMLIEADIQGTPSQITGGGASPRKSDFFLATKGSPCRFWVTRPKQETGDSTSNDFGIFGTLDADQLRFFHTLVPSPLEISYIDFRTDKHKRLEGKATLGTDSPRDVPTYICPSS